MSHLHHIATRFRDDSLPDDGPAPSVSLDDLITLEPDENTYKSSFKDEGVDVKSASDLRRPNRLEYSGPNETMRISTRRNAGFQQITMLKPLAEKFFVEERAGIELGKLRIYAPGTPRERKIILVSRNDGSGKDDVYELIAQSNPTSAEFLVATRLLKQTVAAERRVSSSSGFVPSRKEKPDSDAHLLSLEDEHGDAKGPPVYNTEFSGLVTHYQRAVPTSVATTGQSMNPAALSRHELVKKRTLNTPRHNLHRSLIGLPEGQHNMVLPTSVVRRAGPKDTRTRAPRNVVLDMVFDAFKDRPQISTKDLLEVTDQPSTYLKNVLSAVAVVKNGIWMLKDEFSRPKARVTALDSLSQALTDEKDDEEEDDMEEVV